ncbi:MAG: septum formation initiator family protein [Hydrogenothermaceae bacterium]|nr:septum formation initiator family protein [Hydrogenothermaceae bacterium]
MQYSKEKRHSRRFSIKFPDIGVSVDRIVTLTSLFLLFVFLNTVFLSEKSVFVLKEKIELQQSLQKQMEQLSKENKKLSSQIEYLKSDSFYIEKKAREELGLMREGEEIYILVGYKPLSPRPSEEISGERWIDKIVSKYTGLKNE